VRCFFALLCLILAASPAHAARLVAVRTFTAPGQARLLLELDPGEESTPATIQTRASPPLGAIAARGITWLGGVELDADLPVEVPVHTDGVRRVLLAVVGAGVQVTVELDQARLVRAEQIDPRAVIVDLLTSADSGSTTDGSKTGEGSAPPSAVSDELPTRAQLLAVVQGVDLLRAAGGARKTRPVVVLDAGHGGWDHGAVGPNGTREADIALQIVLRAAVGMRQRLDADVILTRDDDEFVTLRGRARIANQAKADLFVSVHANAAFGPQAWGTETYSMDTASDRGAQRVAARENAIARKEGLAEGDDLLAAQLINTGTMRLSRELAAHVQSAVCQRLGLVYGTQSVHDLGTKTALFTVLTRTQMPAVLFESAFVSNPTDERRLRAPYFQQTIADALVDAVGAWLDRQGDGAEESP